MADKTLRELAEETGIDPSFLERVNCTAARFRAIEAQALQSKDGKANELLWAELGLAEGRAGHAARVQNYARELGIPEDRARGLLACRTPIETFKWRVAEELGCASDEEAQARCREIAAASRAGHESRFTHSETRLASAWQWLARAEEYFDRTDYLTAMQMVAHAGLSSFLAMDLIAWEAEGERGVALANARWARLDEVKEWAFQQRRDDPPPRSRAAVIRRILPEVKAQAKAAGEALTGDDAAVIRTVTGWFRRARIK